jgi:hypothetical protein
VGNISEELRGEFEDWKTRDFEKLTTLGADIS